MDLKHALSAFRTEKPHSSITDWVEILSGENYKEDDYDGIPELVESINLQHEGPGEACRAIRKKLKYGNVHRQIRALTMLKALVENCGPKFQTTFSQDHRITELLEYMFSDSITDARVKRKLLSVMASWHRQFKDEPGMRVISGLYLKCKGASAERQNAEHIKQVALGGRDSFSAQREREKELKEARKAKEREEREKREEQKRMEKLQKEAEWNKAKTARTRKPFNFEQEKPQILNSVASGSQASNNLINALKLVNREKESIQENARVQECLAACKTARKQIVRYIQRVEQEELIGTLIDTNERIIAALDMYDKLSKSAADDSDDTPPPSSAADATPSAAPVEGQLERLQGKQRAAVQRSIRERNAQADVHPDLKDLSFGPLEPETTGRLQAPLRPSAPDSPKDPYSSRGNLSDFSDYDSSEDERAARRRSASMPRASGSGQPTSDQYGASSSSKPYVGFEDDDIDARNDGKKGLLDDDDDPFADPFADQGDVGTPGIPEKKTLWGKV